MARIYGLNGALRGKQGNNVFSIQNGTQVVKAYQPVVANPRTFLQVRQRSKFALAGKISSVVPSGALVGLSGSSSRARRAFFVSNIARVASFTSVDSQLVASVATVDVLFSVGSLARYAPVTSTSAAYQGSGSNWVLRATVSGYTTDPIPASAPAGYGELVVVCMFDPSGSRIDGCQYAFRGADDLAFEFKVASRTGALVAFYICPFCPIDGANALRSVGALYGQDAAVNLNMGLTEFAAGNRWGKSINIININVASQLTSIAPSPATPEGDDVRKKK